MASQSTSAATGMLPIHERITQLEYLFDTQMNNWLIRIGDVPHAEATDFDDSLWQQADIGFQWDTPYSLCWFRRRIEVPQQLAGLPTTGQPLAIRIAIDNGGSIYVDGQLKHMKFDRSEGYAVLTESAKPGDRYLVAIRGINRPGWGSLLDARLETESAVKIRPAISALIEQLKFASTIQISQSFVEQWTAALTATLDAINLNFLE
ncbi:MAG: hypothetical protein ABGX16_17500, partial [Pirellulales bacterium]